MMNEQNITAIPAEKFQFVQQDRTIHDERIKTKPIGYFKDAWLRFVRNKSAVVAFVLIMILILFAIIVPFISSYKVDDHFEYYVTMRPKIGLLAGSGFWDGTSRQNLNQESYEATRAIGVETGRQVITKEYRSYEDAQGITYHDIQVDGYYKVGFAYKNLTKEQYLALMAYQDKHGYQVIYPLAKTNNITFLQGNGGANYWYKLQDEPASARRSWMKTGSLFPII